MSRPPTPPGRDQPRRVAGAGWVVAPRTMTSSSPPSERTDREAVLDRLADTIDRTHDRIAASDPDTAAEQELQIKWIRTLGYLSGQYRKLLKDEDLDEMAAELDLLHADDGEPQ